jgi:hypothetical protein
MKVTKSARLILVSLGLVAVVAVAYYWTWPFLTARLPEDRCPGHERFNPGVWQDTIQVYSELKPRGCMVDDLLARYHLVGMPRAEVVRLLGEPPPTEYFRNFDLVYWLGPERGVFSIDSEWLVMKLDPTGRVVEAKLVTD